MRAIGIDISKWQGAFDYQDNIDFIIQKVSEGTYYDLRFWEMVEDVHEVPIRGAYHYFRTEMNPIDQAVFFNAAQGGEDFQFLAMDYEGHGNTLDKLGAQRFWEFYQKLKELTDKPIVLYTTEYILRDNLAVWNEGWNDVPFWVARYADLDEHSDTPLFLGEKDYWYLWQYSPRGDGEQYGVSSDHVDLNVWNGTIETMRQWLECEPPIVEEPIMKKWYASKTLWFSILFALVNLAGIFGYAEFVPGDEVGQYVSVGIAIVMALLRVFTDKGVEL
jgi:GH25 family lysozyme M1 (1,4-beta-N-acetylmuramidase)